MTSTPDATSAPTRRRPSRRALTLVVVPLVVLVILGYVGDALMPTLVDRHPALLIALNARNRNLALVASSLDPLPYYGIGTVRLLLSDPIFFLLGFWYGDLAVQWMERRTRTWGHLLRQIERWFGKAAYPLVFVAPNNAICLFAGAAGMPLRAFFAVNLTGTLARLWAVRRFGEAFETPIEGIVGWIGDHRVPLLIVSVALVLISVALEARRGESEVPALVHLDDELAGDHATDEADARPADADGSGADDGGSGADPTATARRRRRGSPDG